MTEHFRALVIDERDGKPAAGFRDLALADLPDHDVLVEVRFSTLNYKDGLAVSGKGRIARRLPMVAGVDLSGIVVESRNPDWKPGEKIIVNGWGMSETEWGGYTRFQLVKAEWLTRLPDAFTLEEKHGDRHRRLYRRPRDRCSRSLGQDPDGPARDPGDRRCRWRRFRGHHAFGRARL